MKSLIKYLKLTAFIFLLLPIFSHAAQLSLGIANSTCSSMKKVGEIFTSKTNIQLKLHCQPSGLLAKGIIEGALDIDFFLSANKKWMDDVKAAGKAEQSSIKSDIGNLLVVASLPIKKGEITLTNVSELRRPEVQKIIMGDPNIAPYGMYAKEAMINSGVWEEVQSKLTHNKKISMSVRTLKKYGLSRAGIVAFLYKTNVTGKMLIHFEIPRHLYSEINYYSASISDSKNKEALEQFRAFINSEETRNVFKDAGFVIRARD